MLRALLSATVLTLTLQAPVAGADGSLDLSDYAGKVVVVDFWASWCTPCRRSFPWLNEMHDKYGADGLVIVGVNLDASRDAALTFLDAYPPKFRIVYDDSKALTEAFDVEAMPMSYLIGRNGERIERHFGFKVKKQDEYEAAIVAALHD